MKTIWICFLLSLIWTSACVSAPDQPIHATLSSQLVSKYEFFNGFVGYDDPVIQTDLTATFPAGFQLGVWHSIGLNDADFSSDFGDEVDYTIGWKGNIAVAKVELGISYFDILELGYRTKGVVDVLRPYIAVSQSNNVAEAHKLGPIAKLESRMRVKGDADLGFTLWLGLKHDWEMSSCVSFSQKLLVIGDTGSIGFQDIVLGRYDAGFSYRINKNLAWNIFSFTGTTPFTSAGNGQEPSGRYSTGFAFSF